MFMIFEARIVFQSSSIEMAEIAGRRKDKETFRFAGSGQKLREYMRCGNGKYRARSRTLLVAAAALTGVVSKASLPCWLCSQLFLPPLSLLTPSSEVAEMVSRSFSGRSSLLRILQTPRPRNNVLPALHPIPCLCRAASSKKSQPETSKDPSEPSNSKRTAPVTFSAQDSATEGVVRRFLSEQGLLKPSETQETIQQISVRTRPKLPTAKAKAQASRALREQVAASHIPGEITGEPGVERSTTEAAEMGAGAQLREVVAYATAEEYDLDALIRSGRLPAGWKLLEDDEVLYIPAWPIHASQPTTDKSHDAVADGASDSGEAFIFRSGSYVTWGMSEDQSRRFLPSVIRGRVAKFEVERERYTEIGDEGMDYLFAADQYVLACIKSPLACYMLTSLTISSYRHTRIVGDILVIGQPPRLPGSDASDLSDAPSSSSRAANDSSPWTPLLARLAFSQGLARSARLSVQEGALSTYLASVAPIPAQLETQGRVPLPRKEVVRRMGTLLKLRQRANLDKENFLDDPEIYWENGRMECES